MKIVTLNLWNGGRLFSEALNFLKGQAADIYFLQEAYNGHGELERRFKTVEIMQREFPGFDTFFSPVYLDTREKEGNIEDGQLILSRWPLTEKKAEFLGVEYGPLDQDNTQDFAHFPSLVQSASIEVGEKKIKIINVHGPVNMDGTFDSERRLMMRDTILKNIEEYTVVAGDFNVQAETETIRGLEKKLANIFKGELVTSFNLSRKDLVKNPGYARAVVDMMFVTPNFDVVKKEAPKVDISDHMPLVIEVDFF